MPCGCTKQVRRISGLSSSFEFYQVKAGVDVPENGWTDEKFRTRNGLKLLQSLLRVRRAGVARGMRSLSKILKVYFEDQIDGIVRRVEAARNSLDAKASVTISPAAHENIWAKAIADEFATADMKLRLEYEPPIKSVGVEIHRKTSILMGAPWSDHNSQAMNRRNLKLARQVVGINKTSQNILGRTIQAEVRKGATVKETIDLVKKHWSKELGNRIPTIVRTEMGRAADEAAKQAFKDSETVTHVSVIGCEAIEPSAPTYRGIPTCNIQDVPVEEVDELEFHINHTGTIIPSRFVHDDGTRDKVQPRKGTGPDEGEEGVYYDDPDVNAPSKISALPEDKKTMLEGFGARKVSPSELGLIKEEPPIGGDQENLLLVKIDDVVIGRDALDPRRILQLNTELPDKVITRDGKTPIVLTRSPETGKLVVSGDGNHRIAFLKLSGYKGTLPAVVIEPRAPLRSILPPPVKVPLKDKDGFPLWGSLEDTGRTLGGTTGARLMKDADGDLWVVKQQPIGDAAKLVTEAAADSAYRAAGIPVPDSKLLMNVDEKGKVVKIAKFVEGTTLQDYLTTASASQRAAVFAELRKGFHMDALLANWDVMGADFDNILVTARGIPYRIDNGGSMAFRAQGSLKGKDWNENPTEFWTMRGLGGRSGAAARAAEVFGQWGNNDGWGIYNIAAKMDDLDVDKVLSSLPEGADKLMMAARITSTKSMMQMVKDYQLDDWTQGYADHVAKGVMELRTAGISSRLGTLKVSQGSYGELVAARKIGTEFWGHMKSTVGDSACNLIDQWARGQGGNSWRSEPIGLKHWLSKQRYTVGKVDRYWSGSAGTTQEAEKFWQKFLSKANLTEEQATLAFTKYHAFMQETLRTADVGNADKVARRVRLMRTEGSDVLAQYGITRAKASATMQRGINESASIFEGIEAVSGPYLTIQSVPFTRVTGSYIYNNSINERMFLGDRENEITFVPDKLKFRYAGSIKRSEIRQKWGGSAGVFGNDATQWDIPEN